MSFRERILGNMNGQNYLTWCIPFIKIGSEAKTRTVVVLNNKFWAYFRCFYQIGKIVKYSIG